MPDNPITRLANQAPLPGPGPRRRAYALVMPETGDKVRSVSHWHYVLVMQFAGKKPVIAQRSDSYDKVRRALDSRLRRPYTHNLTHTRPDYAIFDTTDQTVKARAKGDRP